jgi:hypothetical protein
MNENIGEVELSLENKKDCENKKEPKKLPRFAYLLYALAALSLILQLAFILSEPFADFFNKYISSLYRAFMSELTGWIPFSFAEYIVIMLPVIIIVLVIHACKNYSDTWHDVFVYCGTVLSLLGLFFTLFTVGFAPAYKGSRLDKKLGIERVDVSAEELYETALLLGDAINSEVPRVAFIEGGFSVMPYGLDVMNDKLIEAYDAACDKYSFIQRLDSRVKPVMLSEAMSYTHITGIYSFFTGEANLNVAFPDYTLPYTAAHELAHQRGIAREDEANFMAFLVSIESDDSYIRYCAYLNLYEYVMSALYSADPTLYYSAYERVSHNVKVELAAYSAFYEKYRDSVVAEVSGAVNNTFLVIQGTEGTKSYGMVVDLAVAYFKVHG